MHVPSVPAHQKLATDAAAWSEELTKALSEDPSNRAVCAAIMCAGLNIAAAIERAGLGATNNAMVVRR
jgi:hypothetical protein